MQTFIETERLLLREIVESDAQAYFDFDSDPEVHKYLGNQPTKSVEQALEIIQGIRTQYKEYGIGRWAIIYKATNELIGWSGLKYETAVREEFNYYDLGYRMKKDYWGRGIATETAIESLKYGFEKMNLSKICGGADIDNIASNTVLKKVGLKFKETFEFDGAMHHWYELTKADWLKMVG